ncbi:hypothetical protein [Allokutzneria oryzae]|uniref:Uncharacterized protein n=1 Tax=Allokutzneria oryzae TaxID=1378989 RepID=A0ABV5ZQC0_9PSEU
MGERVVDAAKAIRPYLPDMLGEDAERFDLLVSGLLAQAEADPDETALRLEQLLSMPPVTARWLERVLADDQLRPPELQQHPQLGRFECPGKDFVWYPRIVGQRAPICPTHGRPLRGAAS